MKNIIFNQNEFEVKTCTINNCSIKYRAYENLEYCQNPVDSIQKLNIFVPESYYEGRSINGYTLKTAPIFMPNTVGGYMPGPVNTPREDRFGHPNSIFKALEHGYVVVSAGIRGRSSGKRNTEFFEGSKADYVGENTGKLVGKAPALIVDMKAAIRYLRYNAKNIPGDTNKIITSGTSAGGALSALTGATGNSLDYQPYLDDIGALEEKDNIFAANCYCPIHNLEHADMAYEWQFNNEDTYHKVKFVKTEKGIEFIPNTGKMTEEQLKLSNELKNLFPAYVNSLHLKLNDEELTLDFDGNGSFKEYLEEQICQSAQKELDTHVCTQQLDWLVVKGSNVENQESLMIKDGKVIQVDFDTYNHSITRMKDTPAFDSLSLKSPENDEFGTEEVEYKHFTEFSKNHSKVNGQIADAQIVKMLNPIEYIGNADTCKYWRVRHGSFDRDTSLAIPTILSLVLENKGYNVDFSLPWGLPHSGDYDLDELFEWIDSICK